MNMDIFAEKLRRVRGGVGTYNTIGLSQYEAKNKTGEALLGIKLPAGSLIVGATIKNGADDLVGAGASVGLKMGAAELIAPATVATIKGKAVGGAIVEGVAPAVTDELRLNVTGAPLTNGKLDITILYL